MPKRTFFKLAIVFAVLPSVLGAEQGKNVRIVSGGGVSGSGQIKIINLGGVLVGRGGGKLRSSSAEHGKRVAVAAKAAPNSTISAAAGPSAEFKLREVYVFPNPAKRGKVPAFHIEVGIADSVKITVYTVSGEEAHSRTLSGTPAVIEDGNGAEYAYEYAWQGHIPSGVYYYLIEAQKDGRKLKKTGKFAVIR